MNELWNDKEKEILYESLTNEELVRKVQKENDELAKKVLVEKNHKLLHMFTRKYVKYDQGYEYDDIYNECVIGFIAAMYKFDPNFGFKFNTYAGNFAEGQIKAFAEGNDKANDKGQDGWQHEEGPPFFRCFYQGIFLLFSVVTLMSKGRPHWLRLPVWHQPFYKMRVGRSPPSKHFGISPAWRTRKPSHPRKR